MASKFNLTAQLSLAAPTNVPQIVRQVNQQLQGVQMQINPVVNAKSLNQANSAVQQVGVSAKVTSKNLNTAAGSANSLGSALGAAARRFASITLATGFFLALTRALGSAVGRAVEFEREMLKISQVTGKSIKGLRDLSNEVTNLSTTLGVSSEELLNAARTLSQAGFAADKVTGALKILAQTDLAATFDNIKDTTEGAVAILSQFRSEVRAAGGEVQFLEKAMDAINSVSKSFAVESADLISVVRRTGGVFEAAGGKLNELIALFTSVRATTRETADTIATGFRTIFTRIQRSETIDSLKELGIVLQDTEGKFVGPMEAIARLSAGLKALDPRDFRFNEIVEQLGGFRQIGKVIPLIKQYSTSTAALAVANNSLGSTAQDAAIAQQGLGNQFAKLKEQFDATVRSLAGSETFQTLATSAIKLAESILKVVESLEPLLPMLTALAAFKIGQIALPAFGKFAGVGGRHEGGKIHGFAGGGMVPGRGNRDTVPAMLQPGEFVMRKSAVKKIGANNMAEMNNGYAAGGTVTARRSNYGNGFGFEPNKKAFDKALTPEQKQLAQRQMTGSGKSKADTALLAKPVEFLATRHIGGFSTMGGKEAGGYESYTLGGYGPENGFYLEPSDLNTAQRAMIAKNRGLKPQELNKVTQFPANLSGSFSTYTPSLAALRNGPYTSLLETGAQSGLEAAFDKAAGMLPDLSLPPALRVDSENIDMARASSINDDNARKSLEGFLGEGMLAAVSGAVPAQGGASFDLPAGSMDNSRKNLMAIYGGTAGALVKAEVKRSKNNLTSKEKGLPKKTANDIMAGRMEGVIPKYAKGGQVDTVPAMLTPGEFVMKKSAAQGIGYSNLHRMNQSNGVNGYAAGGIVTPTRGNYGPMMPGAGGYQGTAATGTGSGVAPVNTSAANAAMTALAESAGKVSAALVALGGVIEGAATNFAASLNKAASGITSIDNIMISSLTESLTPFGAAMQSTAQGITAADDIMNATIRASFIPFTMAMQGVAQGVQITPKIIQSSLTSALAPLGAALATASKDIVISADMMQASITKAVAPLGTSLAKASEGIAVTDNILTTAIQASMTPLAEAAIVFGESMIQVASFMKQAAMKLTQELFNGIKTLSSAMKNAATQMTGGGKAGSVMQMLNAPVNTLMEAMKRGSVGVGHVATVAHHLQKAMQEFLSAIQKATGNVGKLGIIAQEDEAELDKLKGRILHLEEAMAKMKLALEQGAAKVATGTGAAATTTVATGGGGGGAQMMNQMMMMGMMAGMVTSQMFDMNEETAAYVNTLTMLGPILAMVFLELGNMISAGIINTFITHAESKAKAELVVMTKAQSLAAAQAAAVSRATTGIMIGLAIGIAIVAARSAELAAEAKKLGQEYNKAMSDLKKGQGSMSLGEAKNLASRALQKEAEAANSSLMGYAAVIVTAVAFVALAIATGGASLAMAAAAAIAIAAAGQAGSMAGEAFASVEDALAASTDALVTSTWYAANAMNELAAANKQMELEQLKGLELMKRQGQAFDNLMISSVSAVAAMAGFKGMEAGMDSEINTEMMDSDIFKDVKDGGIEAMRELSKTWFKMASDLARGMNEGVDEMIKAGKSADEAMNSTEIQEQLKKYGQSIKMATQINLMMSGTAKREVKKQMGIADISDVDLSSDQRTEVNRREQALIEKMTADDAKKGQAAQEKSMKDRLAADAAAKKAAAEKLAADIALAQGAYRAAVALNGFEVAMVGMKGAINTVDMEFGALTGSIKAYKSNNDALIATLNSGNVTPEAEKAAMATAGQFGIENETAALLQSMKDNEKIRKALTEKGFKEFSGTLEESAANLRFEDFLKDNNIDLSGLDADIRTEIMNKLKDGLQPGEVEEIMDAINGANEEQIKVLADLAKAQNAYVGALFKFGGEVVKLNEQYAQAISNVINVQLRGAERLAKAQGRDLTTGEVKGAEEARRRAPLQAMGLQGGGVRSTQVQLERRREKAKELADRLRAESEGGQDSTVIANVQNEQRKLTSETKALTANLKKLSDQSKLAAAIMGDIEKEKGKRDTIRGLISEFTFASNQGRKDMDRNFMALQRVMQTGNLNSIPDEMRSAVGGLLSTLEDIAIGPQGQTGGEIKKMLEMQMANQLKIRATGKPLTAEEMQQIFNKTTKEEQLINDLKALNAEEVAAAQALADNEANKIDDLLEGIERLIKVLQAAQANAGAAAGEAMTTATTASQGGVIYASGGQSIFKPKGTDTVPAMLTPGEFVVNSKSAKQHAGTLQAINSGNTKYLAAGGPVTSRHGYGGDQNYIDSLDITKRETSEIKKGISGQAKAATSKIKDATFKELSGENGQVVIENDLGFYPNGKWEDFKLDGELLSLSGGALKRKGLNTKAADALNHWMGVANMRPSGDATVEMINGIRDHDPHGMIQAHRFFSNKQFPNGGTVGANSNSLAWDYWKGDAWYRRQWNAESIRKKYGSGVTPSSGLLSESDRVVNSFPAISKTYRKYKQMGQDPLKSHPKEMDSGAGGINNGLPAAAATEGVRLPNPNTLRTAFNNPGENQFSWLSATKFTEGKHASDLYYSALFGAEGYKSIKENKEALNKSARELYQSSTSSYGYFLHDSMFGRDGFKGMLEKFYKNPGAATEADALAIGNWIESMSPQGGGQAQGRLSMQKTAWKVLGSNQAGSIWDLLRMDTGLTQGPPSGDKSEGISLESLGYVPWDLMGTLLSGGLRNDLSLAGGIPTAKTNQKKVGDLINGFSANFMNEFKTNKEQSSRFLAERLTGVLTAIEGSGGAGDLGVGLFDSVAELVEQEEADKQAEADALALGIANDVIPNLDVFYATKANKKQAMLTSLGEYPGLKGAPYRVGRLPEYTGLRGTEGVTDPRTGKAKQKIQKVTDVKRDADAFDALFPYLRMLSDDVMGIVSVGGITGASPDGSIQFNAQKIADGVGPKTLDALKRWSTVPYEKWYDGGIPNREAERLLGLFWNFKKIDTALRTMSKSTQSAMTMAKELNPRVFDGLFPAGAIPDWLGGNDAPDRVDPMAGFATGGRVGSSANPKPKGTDTVPAMLTPGEFVMKKSAVDKYGTGFMHNINQGSHFSQGGKVAYLNEGGGIMSGQKMVGTSSPKSEYDEIWWGNLFNSLFSSDLDRALLHQRGPRSHGLSRRASSSFSGSVDEERRAQSLRLRELELRIETQLAEDRRAEEEAKQAELAKERTGFGAADDWEGSVTGFLTGITDSEWVERIKEWQELKGFTAEVARKRVAGESAAHKAKLQALDDAMKKKLEENKQEYDRLKADQAKNKQAAIRQKEAREQFEEEQRIKMARPGTADWETLTPEQQQNYRDEQTGISGNEGMQRGGAAQKEDAYVQQQERINKGLPMFDKDAELSGAMQRGTFKDVGSDRRFDELLLKNYAGRQVNIGNWLDDMSDNVALAQEIGSAAAVMTPEIRERAEKMREGQAERKLGGFDRGAGMRNMRKEAEDLLGAGLNYTLPFDIGRLVRTAANAGEAGITVLRKMGFQGFLDSIAADQNLGDYNSNNFKPGYVSGNVRIGEPLPDRLMGSGVTSEEFLSVFGGEALGKFYPTFPKRIDSSLAEAVDLMTLSRGMESDPAVYSQEFLNDVARISNHISGQAVSNTLMGGRFNAPTKGTLEGMPGVELTPGEMGTITDSAGLATGVKYKPNASYRADSWPMDWLPSDLAAKAKDLDVMKHLLPPTLKSWYRTSQVMAQRNALEKGRKILMDNLDAKYERSQGGRYEGARMNDRVGFASGGSVFSPRGTDTVPAMLTPGEFVMKKSAVDKYGVGFMDSINKGRRGAQYLHRGGKVGGGGNAGGGGSLAGLGDLVSSINNTLDAFNQAFTAFSGLSNLLDNIITSISNINITHTINLQGSLNIPGFSQDAVNSIVSTIADQTADITNKQIRQALRQRDRDNENRT